MEARMRLLIVKESYEYDEKEGMFVTFDVKVTLTCQHCNTEEEVSAGRAAFSGERLLNETASLAASISERRDCKGCGTTSTLPQRDNLRLGAGLFARTKRALGLENV